MPVLQDLQ